MACVGSKGGRFGIGVGSSGVVNILSFSVYFWVYCLTAAFDRWLLTLLDCCSLIVGLCGRGEERKVSFNVSSVVTLTGIVNLSFC